MQTSIMDCLRSCWLAAWDQGLALSFAAELPRMENVSGTGRPRSTRLVLQNSTGPSIPAVRAADWPPFIPARLKPPCWAGGFPFLLGSSCFSWPDQAPPKRAQPIDRLLASRRPYANNIYRLLWRGWLLSRRRPTDPILRTSRASFRIVAGAQRSRRPAFRPAVTELAHLLPPLNGRDGSQNLDRKIHAPDGGTRARWRSTRQRRKPENLAAATGPACFLGVHLSIVPIVIPPLR